MLAALLAAVVVGGLASSVHPPAEPTRDLVVAAHDLAPGSVLTAADLAVAPRARGATPPDPLTSVDDVVGRTVAAPLLTGEALRSRDVVSPGLVSGLGPGMRATPVRLADEGAADLVRAGDNVDVLASFGSDTGSGATATVVASAVRVLVAPAGSGSTSTSLLGGAPVSSTGGALLVLATTQGQALDLARAAAGGRLSVALRPD